jgi:hypothetical protein
LPQRPGGPVLHPGLAQLAVAVSPPLRGRPGDLEALRGPRDRPAVVDDQLSEAQSGSGRQSSVGVHDEDLLVCEMGAFSSSTSRQEVLVVQQVISASSHALNQPPGQYS